MTRLLGLAILLAPAFARDAVVCDGHDEAALLQVPQSGAVKSGEAALVESPRRNRVDSGALPAVLRAASGHGRGSDDRGSGVRRGGSTADNTAVYMAASRMSGVKFMLLKELVRVSPYPVVIGYDVKAKASVPANVENMLRLAAGGAREVTIVPVSNISMVQKYGDRISNYSGVYQDNPAKLAVMDWFNSSSYDFLWHLEDDTWARGFDKLSSEVASHGTDLIIKNASSLPFWAEGNSSWRVGDQAKLPTGDFLHCLPALFRMSRRFARSVLQEILDSDTTNHHEVWWPYVVQNANLSWEPLPLADNLHFNVKHDSDSESSLCLEDIRMNESLWLVHPVKCIHHGLRGE